MCSPSTLHNSPTAVRTFLLCLLTSAIILRAEPPQHQAWTPVPLLSDDFTGAELDTSRWKRGNHQWEGHPPGLFKDGNVSLKDGQLHVTMKMEPGKAGDGTARSISTGSITSRARIRYGWFECRLQAMPSAGSSAFWLAHNAPEQWTELDICELCGHGEKYTGKVFMNAHSFHAPGSTTHHEIPAVHDTGKDLCAAFHTYAMEWSATHVAWYLDGTMLRREPNTHWHQPLYVLVDSNTLADWFGVPAPATLPSTLRVDYVKTWQRTPPAAIR